jgi:hypothetical protein
MGSCPLHPPDRHPSFGVNREEQWWIDFRESPALAPVIRARMAEAASPPAVTLLSSTADWKV